MRDLLEQYVRLHNEGVRTGDFSKLLAHLPRGGRAVYGWSRRPHLPAGELRLQERNGLISELLVTSGARS
jgi:hypothetical protein